MSKHTLTVGDVVITEDLVDKYHEKAAAILGWAGSDRDVKKAEVWAYMARTEVLRRESTFG